jgi:hypothetical protein
MKLCPQCEFIYEDDQSFCDMDGKELVHDAGTLAFEETAPSIFAQPQELAESPISLPYELTPTLSPVLPDSLPSRGQSRSFAVAGAVGVVLVALLFVAYYVRTQAAAPPASVAASRKQASSASSNLMPASPSPSSVSSAESAGGPRAADVPVSAAGAAADSYSAIIWLTNGTSIKADQVWEGKEGIWYRQAGVVTLLKRSQVKSIQRLAPRSESTPVSAEEKNRKPQNAVVQNRPRASRPEPTDAKKESRVSLFLKKTGRILKKPFQF